MQQYHAGQILTVQLGVPYDAASDYLYDGSLVPAGAAEAPSCQAVDGLETGAVLTFTLTDADEGFTAGCGIWDATVSPDPLNPQDAAGSNVGPPPAVDLPDETIAIAAGRGSVGSRPAGALRALVTPSKDANGTLVSRQLPPLVVTREIDWGDPSNDRCFDSWVASWETMP